MKKTLIDLINKNYNTISDSWINQLTLLTQPKLTKNQFTAFIQSSLNTFIRILDANDYKIADKYLIDQFELFSKANLNLLEISKYYCNGRSILSIFIDNQNFDKGIENELHNELDDLIEQLFARFGILYQETRLKELNSDSERLISKLELNNQYLKNILQSTDQAIMMVDNYELFIAWNKGAEKIFGYTENEIIGKHSSFLLPKGDKYIQELKRIQEEVQKNGQIRILDTERITKNGEIISVRLNVTKLLDKNEKYAGRSIIIKDYTEFKKLQAQIDQSEKLAVIGQIAAGVAHEIGNPLTSISSIVQILQRRNQDQFVNDNLVNIKENIDRISKIVRELVDFSRPPSYETANQDITDIIKTALGIVKFDKRVHNVNFQTDLLNTLPNTKIAADQLLQVFVNILINALDAIKGDGTIKVNSYKDDSNIYIEISDNGCGMDEFVLEKIFDPFFTTKEVGKGTGLGLSVSYGIVKRFNGSIKVKSKINEGSTFTVVLPKV